MIARDQHLWKEVGRGRIGPSGGKNVQSSPSNASAKPAGSSGVRKAQRSQDEMAAPGTPASHDQLPGEMHYLALGHFPQRLLISALPNSWGGLCRSAEFSLWVPFSVSPTHLIWPSRNSALPPKLKFLCEAGPGPLFFDP